jgi:hypothetical protein
MTRSSTPLDAKELEQAVKAMSRSSGFWFTRRCLMFELCRRNAWPDPGTDLDGCEREFAAALAEHESRTGQLARLVRPETAIAGIGLDDLETFDLPADLFDYSIQRVAVFQRKDLCLMLIANGLHREIELALTVPPDFPTHVWARIRAQLDAGLRTTFLAVHDCGAASEAWLAEVEEQLGSHDGAEVFGVGLTVPWAFRLRIPVRGAEPGRAPAAGRVPAAGRGPTAGRGRPLARGPAGPAMGRGPAEEADDSFEPMLRSGSYALLEELTPLRAMRWIYGRVARGAEDVGFG